MSAFVVDASVAVKWIVRAPDSDRAILVLESADQLVAPDLLLSEVGNAIWKQRLLGGNRRAETPPDRIDRWILGLPIEMVPSRDLLNLAIRVAFRYGRSVYDSIYVALALTAGSPLVTADRKLARALASTEIAHAVLDLSDFDPLDWS